MDRSTLKDTKAKLKCLIVSCPHGLTIEQLNRDYQKMIGEKIPYGRLGFKQLEPFLRSLTDTLVVHGSGLGAKVIATQVDKLQHIDKMISCSKNTTIDRKRQTAIRDFKTFAASATTTQNVPSYSRPPLLPSPPIISTPSPPVPPLLLNNMYPPSVQSHYQSGPVYYNNYGNYNRRYTPPQPFYHPIPEVNAQYWARQQQQYLSEYNKRRQQQQLHWLFENYNQLQNLYANENSVQEKFNNLNITKNATSNQQDTIKPTQNNVEKSQSIDGNLNYQKNSSLNENLNNESVSNNDEGKYNWESTENHAEVSKMGFTKTSENDNNVSRSYQSKLQQQQQQKGQMWRTQNNVEQSQSIDGNLNYQKNSPLDENLNKESTSKSDEVKYNWESTGNHAEISKMRFTKTSENDNNESRYYQSKSQQQKVQMWRTQNNVEQSQSIDGNFNYQKNSPLDENLNKESTSKNDEVKYNWESTENHAEISKMRFTKTSENDNNESRYYQSKSQQQQQQQQNVQMWRRRTIENHVNNVTEEEEKNNRIKFTIRNPNLANRQISNQNLIAEYDGLDGNQTDDRRSQISINSNSTVIQSSLGGISSISSGRFKKSFVEINSAAVVKEKEIDLSKKEEEGNVKQLPKSWGKELLKQQEKPKDVKRKTRKISDSEAIPELAQNDIVFLLDFPPNSVKFGEKIVPSEIPSNIVEEAWFGIFIVEVNNPYKFWFHVYKEEHELDVLMQDLENFYQSLPANELQIRPSNIKAGQICAAPFGGDGDNTWHRAEILDNPNGQYVKVFFVDYGTIAKVNISDIKYLVHEFSTLPSQALRGCLAYIKPIGHRWTREATISFLDMITHDKFEKFLYAKATEIDYKERVVHMIVTDTNDEKDFQLNDALIRKGHARFCKEAYYKGLQNQKNSSTARHFQQKYPTFDMLERGEYPSYNEINELLARGIDIEAREDQSILPDIDENISIGQFTKELTNFTIVRQSDDDEENRSEEEEDEKTVNANVINDDELYLLDNISNNSNDSHYFVRLNSFSSSSISSSKSKTFASVIEREKPEIETNSIHKDEIIISKPVLQNNNPFIQNQNPFLSSKSSSSCCSPSVYNSSRDESTETEVEKKDVSSQCDISNDNNGKDTGARAAAKVPLNFDNCTSNLKQQLQQYPINMSQQFDLYISPGNNIMSQPPYIPSGDIHSNVPSQLSGSIPPLYNAMTPHHQLPHQVPQQIINYSTASTASGWQLPPPYMYNSGSSYCPPLPSFNNNINPLFSQTNIPAPNRILSTSTGVRIPPGFEDQVLNRRMPPDYNVNYFKS